MSHHLDSPIARQDIRLDITDLYLFRGQTGTVFVINVCHSIFGPIPLPGYHPEGMYEFKVDLKGDAVEEITYRFTFNERDENGKQSYVVRHIKGAVATDPHAAGAVKFRAPLRTGRHGPSLRKVLPKAVRKNNTSTFTTKDGTAIYYKDWGTGPVIIFSHGWPLNADAWDAQMLFLGQKGYRVIAHDRRGHGRSGQTWHGNNMDQYADDLA